MYIRQCHRKRLAFSCFRKLPTHLSRSGQWSKEVGGKVRHGTARQNGRDVAELKQNATVRSGRGEYKKGTSKSEKNLTGHIFAQNDWFSPAFFPFHLSVSISGRQRLNWSGHRQGFGARGRHVRMPDAGCLGKQKSLMPVLAAPASHRLALKVPLAPTEHAIDASAVVDL